MLWSPLGYSAAGHVRSIPVEAQFGNSKLVRQHLGLNMILTLDLYISAV